MGQLHYFIPDESSVERIQRLREIRDEIDVMIKQAQRDLESDTQPELFNNSDSTP
jgi:hypothetical protein